MTEPLDVAVAFTLSLDTEIGRWKSKQISEDDYTDQPMTLLDAIVESASARLVDKLVKDAEGYRGLKAQVAEVARITAEAQVIERISAAIDDAFTPTNEFGEQTGKTTTVREQIAAEIRRQLGRNQRRDMGREGATVFDDAVKHVAADLVAKELKADIDAAKARIREELAASTGAAAAKMLGVGA